MAINEGLLRSVIGDLNLRPAKEAEIVCAGCRKRPYQIEGFAEMALDVDDRFGASPGGLDDWIRSNEGTYNPETNRFLCDQDYIRAGMPSLSGLAQWKCP